MRVRKKQTNKALHGGTYRVALLALGVALSTTACGAIQEMATQVDCAQEYAKYAGDLDQDSTAAEIAEVQEELLEEEDFADCGFGDESIETDSSLDGAVDTEVVEADSPSTDVVDTEPVDVDSSVNDAVDIELVEPGTNADGELLEISSAEEYAAYCRLSENPIPGSLDSPHPIGETVTACMDGEIWSYSIDSVRIGEPTGTPPPLMGTNYDCAIVVGTAKLEWYNQASSSVPLFPWSKLAAGGEWGSDTAWACEATPEEVAGLTGDKGTQVELGTTQGWFSVFRIGLGSEFNYVEIDGNYFVK